MLAQIEGQQLAFGHDRVAADIDIAHGPVAGTVDQAAQGIVHRHHVRMRQIDSEEIGLAALCQSAEVRAAQVICRTNRRGPQYLASPEAPGLHERMSGATGIPTRLQT